MQTASLPPNDAGVNRDVARSAPTSIVHFGVEPRGAGVEIRFLVVSARRLNAILYYLRELPQFGFI
jgi:hypothetical protein